MDGVLMEILPVVYTGSGKLGDFSWMREQEMFKNSLYIFNDNEEQFDAYIAGRWDGYSIGGGNAVARPWRQLEPPLSAGIPTGVNGVGYPSLTNTSKSKIDEAFLIVENLAISDKYERIVFSRDSSKMTLGTGIFEVGAEVCDYIFNFLMSLDNRI